MEDLRTRLYDCLAELNDRFEVCVGICNREEAHDVAKQFKGLHFDFDDRVLGRLSLFRKSDGDLSFCRNEIDKEHFIWRDDYSEILRESIKDFNSAPISDVDSLEG